MTDDELKRTVERLRELEAVARTPDHDFDCEVKGCRVCEAIDQWNMETPASASALLDALAATRAKLAAAEARERKLREAVELAYPILHYYGHPPGEQHVNASPSKLAYREAFGAARAALAARSADAGTEPPAEPSATGAGTDEPKEKA